MRGRALLGAGLLVAAVALLAVVASDAPARWLVVQDPPEPVDAAVVMAGDPDYERTLTAARLVRSGQARLLVLTGGQPGPGDSAASLRARAMAVGVPAGQIRSEEVSTSTRQAVQALRPLLAREGVRSVVLVTSPYHQRRAWLAARKAWPGVRIVNCPAQPSFWSPTRWWVGGSARIVAGEYLKLAYYGLRRWI